MEATVIMFTLLYLVSSPRNATLALDELHSFMREMTVIQQNNTGSFSCQSGVGTLHKQQET